MFTNIECVIQFMYDIIIMVILHTKYMFCAVNKCFKKIIFYYYNYQFLNEFHFGF